MIQVLFLGDDDANLTQMAVGFARRDNPADVHVLSAGVLKTSGIDARAIETMGETGVDISYQLVMAWEEIPPGSPDIIVTLSEKARKRVQFSLPGDPVRVDWQLENPFDEGPGPAAKIPEVRDRIARLVEEFFRTGYHRALLETDARSGTVLDSLKNGIIVHDNFRRITYFNTRAEEITGYKKKNVLGNDCHQVFNEKFCGEKCSFCEDPPDFDVLEYPLHILRKDGTRIWVNFAAKAIRDRGNNLIGVLATIDPKDKPREGLKRKKSSLVNFHGILSRNPEMFRVFELIESVARTGVPVLIQGASGTGKELVARALHRESLRKDKVFLPINCGALPENLLESELFGYVKGAFTGATKDKKGRFELADGGTIFLDEIAEVSPAMQVKLLRVLQEGTFERLGDTKTLTTDVRIISATNKDLRQQVIEGKFREDLYYRLCVIPINLPLLQQRREDVSELAREFITHNRIGMNPNCSLTPQAVEILKNYSWPGNIRELQNAIQFALIKSQGEDIRPMHLPPNVTVDPADSTSPAVPGTLPVPGEEYLPVRRKLTPERVRETLLKTDGNKAKTARLLGVGRATLYRFLKRHPGLEDSG